MKAFNEITPMTRRYPNLKQKVLKRDSEIAKKLIALNEAGEEEKFFQFFLKEKKNLSDERYWELLRSVWIVCGGLARIKDFLPLFKSTRKERYYFSTPEEQARLRSMPEEITVFRACDSENDGGISWTTSRPFAEDYKKRFNKALLLEKKVKKSQVFAFIERRGEEEVLILPQN